MTSHHNRTLEIGLLVRTFPNIVQTYILNHAKSIIDSGNDCRIIAERDPRQDEINPDVIQYGLLDRTRYINATGLVNSMTTLASSLLRPSYWSAVLRIIGSGATRRRGLRYLIQSVVRADGASDRSIDIAHSHSLFNTYQYLFLKDSFDLPIVTTYHGQETPGTKPLPSERVDAAIAGCDAFIVNTRFAARQLIDMGCDDTKIHIIPQATDTRKHPYIERTIDDTGEVNILSVGRLSPEKGFDIAIRAIIDVLEEHPNIVYNIVGYGGEHEHLSSLIRDSGNEDRIRLLGMVSTEELQEQYEDAHLFILPSIDADDGTHTETQGVVLQEAQSHGIPVIASRSGGIPEVIQDGRTGLLFDQKDSRQLSDHIITLIEDEERYTTLRAHARRDIEENYSLEAIIDRQLTLYRSLLEGATDDGHE